MPSETVSRFGALSDTDLQRMERSAWREASRAWSECRANDEPTISNMLNESAWSAEHFWRALHDERIARGIGLDLGTDR